MYSGAMLIDSLQRKKVSSKGLTFVSCAVAAWTTSLAVRSVALWVRGKQSAFVYHHLMARVSAAILVLCLVFSRSAFCMKSKC